jgi:protein TonB
MIRIPPAAAEAGQSSGEVTPPRFAQQPKPEYPLLARQQGWEGTVTLHIELLANGTVGTVEVAASSGYPSLDAAAQEAVQRWTHTPARRHGTPVTSWTKLNFTFTLNNEAETNR